MKKILLPVLLFFAATEITLGQEAPNLINAITLSPTTEKASKIGGENVNLFTGVPQIGVPLYSYNSASNGLSLSISLDYFAGGVQVPEQPTNVGLGWYLNGGGIVTRTIRGMADDGGEDPLSAYLYNDTIPNDFRSYSNSYYNDWTDAEQDIYQYNFGGRSGSFYIGKNLQVVQVPLTKMKIVPLIYSYQITGFKFITGVGGFPGFGADN